MTRASFILRVVAASALVAFAAPRVGGQGTSTQPAPHVAPSPPPAAPQPIAAAAALTPTDSSVALCKNGTWIYKPGAPADCAQRGGLLVAMPPRAVAPSMPTAVAAVAAQASVVAPAKVAIAPPTGSTMQCKDGTFLTGTPGADRCAGNGGVAAIFNRPAPAPSPPSRP